MSAGRRKRLREDRRRRERRVKAGLVASGLAVAVVGGGLLMSAVAVDTVGDSLRAQELDLEPLVLGENTRIYDSDNRLLGTVASERNRQVVRSERIPRTLKDATVAIEDKRFYEHEGVDYNRLVGAAIYDLQTGTSRQGGSTITMQLMKNLYEPGATRTLGKKVEEAYLAYQYERDYTKDQILSTYLNGVFYGNNAVGVQSAALTYFDQDVWRITLPQAALLAGLPQAPSAYDPFSRPREARTRRNLVLDEMAGQGYITRAKAEQAKRAGLDLKRGTAYSQPAEQYFFEYVRQALVEEYGEREVQEGGFKVYTTIDRDLQRHARQVIADNLYEDDDPDAAVVMVDSRRGFIKAMASSQALDDETLFNFAAQALRQTGSSAKTFALTAAIEGGISPSTTYISRPIDIVDDDYGPVEVSNYSNSYRGSISLHSATLSSDNSVYTQLGLDVDPANVVAMAEAMGIPEERELPVVPSVVLGSGSVTPLDMAGAYAPLSNGGFRVTPQAIVRVVKPDGETDTFRPDRQRIFSDGVAAAVTEILEANITGGTGGNAQIGVPVAGKTGTTDDFADAWFVGYTPEYSTAVWMGYPNSDGEKRYMTNVHGAGSVSGGTLPAAIWGDFMALIAERRGPVEFPEVQEPAVYTPFTSPFTEAAQAAAAQAAASAAATEEEEEEAEEEAEDEEEAAGEEGGPEGEAPAPPPGPAPAPAPAPTPAPAAPVPVPAPPPVSAAPPIPQVPQAGAPAP